MTVAKLIEELQKFDPALEIAIHNNGYLIKTEEIKLKTIKPLYFTSDTWLQLSH
jgi:hypothetical protein